MRKSLLTAVLSLALLYGSGCATIVGAIIGNQSGEVLAGAAIGAALDFGPAIVQGVGQMLAKPEKDIHQAEIDSSRGQIILPKSAFTSSRLECLTRHLQEIFTQNQWAAGLTQKKKRVGRTVFEEKWLCKTKDGVEFEMTVRREKNKKPEILVEPLAENADKRSEITIQVFDWLTTAAKQKC